MYLIELVRNIVLLRRFRRLGRFLYRLGLNHVEKHRLIFNLFLSTVNINLINSDQLNF
jgi:hypothetical protein